VVPRAGDQEQDAAGDPERAQRQEEAEQPEGQPEGQPEATHDGFADRRPDARRDRLNTNQKYNAQHRRALAHAHAHTQYNFVIYGVSDLNNNALLNWVGRVGVWCVCGCAIEFDELGGRGFEENDIFYNFLTPHFFLFFIKKKIEYQIH